MNIFSRSLLSNFKSLLKIFPLIKYESSFGSISMKGDENLISFNRDVILLNSYFFLFTVNKKFKSLIVNLFNKSIFALLMSPLI